MQDCILIPNKGDPAHPWKCERCGELFDKQIRANCKATFNRTVQAAPAPIPCIHRGPKSGEVAAKKCCGNFYQLDSHFCKKHGECVLYPYAPKEGEEKKQSCATCPDVTVEIKMPCTAERITNFGMAAARHAAAGLRNATIEQIRERWEHCKACPFLENNACKICGCHVSEAQTGLNKLAWAEQECPHNPPFWGPV